MKTASVKINESSKGFLSILAKSKGKTQQDYLSTALDYIYVTGLDIYNKKTINVGDRMKALENRVIGFMKKRETDFFVPMSQKMTALTEKNVELLQSLETLDVLDFSTRKETEIAQPKFKVPNRENRAIKEENGEGSKTFTDVENKKTVDSVELETQKERAKIYKSELEFLMARINKGSGLHTGKFVANITQRDTDRINRILNDN